MLLSTAFFPPVSWFAAAVQDWGREAATNPSSVYDVYIEAHESYCKQSYRNRCVIAAAGGQEAVSVPVVHEGDIFHTPITGIKVDYTDPWVKKAERAIDSAYGTSAFFEYYRDDVFGLLESGIPTLWDLNLSIINYFIRKIRLGIKMVPTGSFLSPGHPDAEALYGQDCRYLIHPKKENTILRELNLEKPYFQVFAGKYGFISDLSVMDLLFNEGPDSLLFIVSPLHP